MWLKLEVVNGLANESVRGTQIPHYGVNIDNDDDMVCGRLLKFSGLQDTVCVHALGMHLYYVCMSQGLLWSRY